MCSLEVRHAKRTFPLVASLAKKTAENKAIIIPSCFYAYDFGGLDVGKIVCRLLQRLIDSNVSEVDMLK